MGNSILDAVRDKYPQYANMDDGDLAGALAQKYPVYLNDPEFHKLVNPGQPQITAKGFNVSTTAGGKPLQFNAGPAEDGIFSDPNSLEAPLGQRAPKEQTAGEEAATGVAGEFGRNLATLAPLSPSEAVGLPSVLAQKGGKFLLGAMADLASTEKGQPSKANMDSYANQPNADMPVEEGLKELHGLASIPTKAAAGLIRTVPALGVSAGAAMAGAPSAVASALPMIDNDKGEVDPYGAMIAAGLPGVSGYAEKFVGAQLAKLPTAHLVAQQISMDPLQYKMKLVQRLGGIEISNDAFRKYLEAGGGAVAANAYLLASQAPAIMALPADQRKEAIMDSVAGNMATSLLAFSSRPGASETFKASYDKLQKLWQQTQDDRAMGGAGGQAPAGGGPAGPRPVPPVLPVSPGTAGTPPVNPAATSPAPESTATAVPTAGVTPPREEIGVRPGEAHPRPMVPPVVPTVTPQDESPTPAAGPQGGGVAPAPAPTPVPEKAAELTGWAKHVETLNTTGLPAERYGEALTELTGDDASLFVPGMDNNARIALGMSHVGDFEKFAKLGIVPGAQVMSEGKPVTLNKFVIQPDEGLTLAAEVKEADGTTHAANPFRFSLPPAKHPGLMTPEEYAKHQETLAPHDRAFVPASANVYGVPLHDHEAEIYQAMQAGQPVPKENLDLLRAHIKGELANRAEVKASGDRIAKVQMMSGWLQARDSSFSPRGALTSASHVLNAAEKGEYNDLMHPQNPHSRALFHALTGVRLPDGVKATQALFTGKPFPTNGLDKKPATPATPTTPPTPQPIPTGVPTRNPPPKAETPAIPQTDLSKPANVPTPPAAATGKHPGNNVADMVKSRLEDGQTVNPAQVKNFGEAHGLDERQSGEWAELGVTEVARDIAQNPVMTVQERFFALVSLYERMPTNGTRTVETKVNQQYSTPPPLAFVAGLLADLRSGKLLAEPTAGHGMLTIGANWLGKISLNELDPQRRERLERYAGSALNTTAFVSAMDATGKSYLDKLGVSHPDRLAMNPPFGNRMLPDGSMEKFTVAGAVIKNVTTTSLDTAIMLNTFNAMSADGKGFAIIGAKTGTPFGGTFGTPKERADEYRKGMFLDLFHRFNVVDWFTIGGELYRKMGAAWPVDVIIVHGKGKTPSADAGGPVRPWVKAPRVLTTWEEVAKLIPASATDNTKLQPSGVPMPELSHRQNTRAEMDAGGLKYQGFASSNEGGRLAVSSQGDTPEEARARAHAEFNNQWAKRLQARKAQNDIEAGKTGGSGSPGTGGGAGGPRSSTGSGGAGGPGTPPIPVERPERPAGVGVRGGVGTPLLDVERPNPTPRPPDGVNGSPGADIGKGPAEPITEVAGPAPAPKPPGSPPVGGGGKVSPGSGPDESEPHGVEPKLSGFRPEDEERLQAEHSANKFTPFGYAGFRLKRAITAFREVGKWRDLDATGRARWQRSKAELQEAESLFSKIRANPDDVSVQRAILTTEKNHLQLQLATVPSKYHDSIKEMLKPVQAMLDALPEPTPAPVPKPPITPQPPAEGLPASLMVPYQGVSKGPSLNLVAPRNIASQMQAAQLALEKEAGKTIDEYLAGKLSRDVKTLHTQLAGAQVDTAALAIRNIERGSALICAHETGVGKGRVVAALIEYARGRGLIPIFLTAKPNLYSDMVARDLPALGNKDFKPFITNTTFDYEDGHGNEVKGKGGSAARLAEMQDIIRTGKLPGGAHGVFTTYDQLKSDKPVGHSETPAQKFTRQRLGRAKGDGPRFAMLRALAPRAIFIMDESHLASGPASDINLKMREILPLAGGVYYSSATFAKRPDNLGLYALGTLMRRSGLNNEQMTEALTKGGVPLQQALTSMLAESGELIRLQQDWTGVGMHFESTGGEHEVEAADTYTSFLRDLITLSKQLNKVGGAMQHAENMVRADEAKVKLEAINFGSRLFSLSNQYLFSLRAGAVVDKAVAELKAGRKPFIHVHNTLEGPMQDLTARGLPMTFGGMLRREMEKMMVLTVRDPMEQSGKRQVEVAPEALEDGGAFYHRMEDEINASDWSKFPISPIDHIKRGIAAAVDSKGKHYSCGEITARDGEVDDSGAEVVVTKRQKQERRKILDAYNNGQLDVLLINGSGGTGLSAHTDPKFKDQRQRSYIEAQPAPDINDEMQAMGRTMRSGQTSKPIFTFLTTKLAAERRFATMLRGKMKSLNANTTAEGESGLTQQAGFADDIFNTVGDDVVYRVMEANEDIARQLEINVAEGFAPDNFARSATGKFPLLPNADADRLWNEIIEEYQAEIARLDEAGENPLKATAEDLNAHTLNTTELEQGAGTTAFDGPVNLERCAVNPPKHPPTHAEALQRAKDNLPIIRAQVKEWLDKSRAAEAERLAVATAKDASDEQLDRIRATFQHVRVAVTDAARMIGDTFGVNALGDGSSAYYVVAGELKLAGSTLSHFASASRQQLILTTNRFRSRQALPLSKLYAQTVSSDYLQPMDDDEGAEQFDKTAETSTERHIITGNLLRGWDVGDAATQGHDVGKPRVTIYTKSDGSLNTGILMPSAWNPGEAGAAAKALTEGDELVAALHRGSIVRSLPTSSVHPVTIQLGGVVSVPSTGQGRLLWADSAYKNFFDSPPQQREGNFVGKLRGASPYGSNANVVQFFDWLQSKGVRLVEQRPGGASAAGKSVGGGGGGVSAARGAFISGVPHTPGAVPPTVTYGGMSFVHPLHLPELVRLTRDLTGGVPSVRPLPQRGNLNTWGKFTDGMITLDPLVFKDPVQAAQMLGHELGHLVDYLPHETLKRGNLLGHLLALKSWLKQNFGPLNNAALKKELMAVTLWWRPYNPATDPKSYVAYRATPAELYADALSVMFNAPAELEKRAPQFYKAFWDKLGNRPEVSNALFNIQEYLNKGMMPTAQERENALMEGFKQGEAIWKQSVADREAMAKSFDHWWESLAQELYWEHYPMEKRAKMVEARGVKLAPAKDPRHFLDDYGYRSTTVMRWGRHIFERVLQPLEAAGLTIDDAGKYLFYTRIMDGDRAQLANSGGIDPTAARLGLLKMRLDLGLPKMTLLAHHIQIFHDDVFKLAEQAVECGAYNKETFDTVIKPNRDTYATFAVLEYLDDYLPPGITQQIGTLKATANSFPATILKSIGLINLIAFQQAKNKTVGFLQQYFPEDITKAGDTHPTDRKGKGIFKRLENGRPRYYYCDPYIAKAFEQTPAHLLWGIVKPMDWAFRKLVYPLIITYNPAFLYIMQPGRDLQRTARNLPGVRLGVGMQPLNYLRNIPNMTGRFQGNPSDIIREMEDNLGIAPPFDMLTKGHRDDFLGDLMRRMNVAPQDRTKGIFANEIFKPIRGLLDRMEFGGNVLIDLSRVAAYTQLRKQGQTPGDAAYWVRNFSGIPNLNKRGLLIKQVRSLVPFWNVFMQGWRADAHLATDPTTRSGWWMRYMMGNGLARLLLAGAAAGALGAAIKELFDGIGVHDKTNYLCIPVGQTSGGDFGKRTVYVRLPEDFTARMIGGMITKGVANMTGKDPNWDQMLDFGMGQFPDLNPALTVPQKWEEYARGRNPTDDFRGQQIIPDRVFKAGDYHGAEVMGMWTLNQMGVLNLASFNAQAQSGTELGVSAIPGINKFVKVSDQGYREDQRAEQAQIDAQRDMQFLKLSDKVQSLELEYWRLTRINKDERTIEQEDRLHDLKAWYQNVYRPAWGDIADATADKKPADAAAARKTLDEDSKEYYRQNK